MDIYCKHCGEPVDLDELHYVDAIPLLSLPPENQISARTRAAIFNATKTMDGYLPFSVARELFYELGCSVFEGISTPCKREPICSDFKLDAINATQELLGSDVDGVAAMLEDFTDFESDFESDFE